MKKLSFFSRILWFVFGFLGLLVTGPWSKDTTYYWRGGVPMTSGTGLILAFFCILAMAYAIIGKKALPSLSQGLYEDHICPKCERVFLRGEKPKENKCPDCKVLLEPLEGFYDRYPELKNVKEKLPKNLKDLK